jgi:choice-of-anchor B domain-containing protein
MEQKVFLKYNWIYFHPQMYSLSVCVAVFALCLTQAKDIPECTIGGWGEWSECLNDNQCPVKDSVSAKSFSVPARTGYDHGRSMMEIGMELKKKDWAKFECRTNGTCPDEFKTKSNIFGKVSCVNGHAGEYECDNVDLLSYLNFDTLHCGYLNNNAEGSDIWGWEDTQTGKEYALVGISTGTSFVDISDPEHPIVLAFMKGTGSASWWRDIAVVNDHAYVISESMSAGLQVFDLNRLRSMSATGCQSGSGNQVEEDTHYRGFANSHNIVGHQATEFIYVVGATYGGSSNICSGGLLILDVRDPKNPKYIDCFGDDGYVHDAECVIYHGDDSEHKGKEICFCYNEDSLTIVDVTNKANMNILSREEYTNSAYSHQGVLSEDHNVLLLDDELDETYISSITHTQTYIWDIKDLDHPHLVRTFSSPETAIDHNMYIVGTTVYQANYAAGLRILDLDNMYLGEVAYFDCFPPFTTVSFYGAWSNYPYYKSGVVVIDSIDYGLYVVKPNAAAMKVKADALKAARVEGHQSRTATVVHAKEGTSCPELRETRQCKAPTC